MKGNKMQESAEVKEQDVNEIMGCDCGISGTITLKEKEEKVSLNKKFWITIKSLKAALKFAEENINGNDDVVFHHHPGPACNAFFVSKEWNSELTDITDMDSL